MIMTTTTMTSRRYSSCRIFTSTCVTTTVLLLLATTFQLASLVLADEPEPRIVGGVDAGFNEYPFFTSWGRSCGATLIHDDILLTAAHVSCKKDFDRIWTDCNRRFFFDISSFFLNHILSLLPCLSLYSAILLPRTK
jgi:hypothetical protein